MVIWLIGVGARLARVPAAAAVLLQVVGASIALTALFTVGGIGGVIPNGAVLGEAGDLLDRGVGPDPDHRLAGAGIDRTVVPDLPDGWRHGADRGHPDRGLPGAGAGRAAAALRVLGAGLHRPDHAAVGGIRRTGDAVRDPADRQRVERSPDRCGRRARAGRLRRRAGVASPPSSRWWSPGRSPASAPPAGCRGRTPGPAPGSACRRSPPCRATWNAANRSRCCGSPASTSPSICGRCGLQKWDRRRVVGRRTDRRATARASRRPPTKPRSPSRRWPTGISFCPSTAGPPRSAGSIRAGRTTPALESVHRSDAVTPAPYQIDCRVRPAQRGRTARRHRDARRGADRHRRTPARGGRRSRIG